MNRASVVHQGIVNVSPDSFSDGGLYCDPRAALEQAQALVQTGAHIIDIGGVSTRPGAQEVSPEVEIARLLPALRLLRQNLPPDVLVSLDTSSPEVAFAAARESLVDIVNDVFAARKLSLVKELAAFSVDSSPSITTADIAAHFKLGLILMHMQGTPASMQMSPTYNNCTEDVFSFLKERVTFARQCGVQWLAVDPGIGFGKSLEHNLSLLSTEGINKLCELGLPVLIGLSRKSFLKALAERSNSYPVFDSPLEEMKWRDQQSEFWERSCIAAGARIIRTHVIKTFH